MELSKQGLQILSRLVEIYKRGQESQQALEREKLEFERWKALAKVKMRGQEISPLPPSCKYE